VLDVGAGAGELVADCRRAGVRAVGVERHPRPGADAAATVAASAFALPFPDAAFDWVALRHVLHHLRDPARALAEAARVARAGIALAEPWFDAATEDGRTALALERWANARDAAAGRHHALPHAPEDAAAWLPDPGGWTLAVERVPGAGPRPLAEVEAELAARPAGLPGEPRERAELARLLERAAATGVARNGTAIALLRRARA